MGRWAVDVGELATEAGLDVSQGGPADLLAVAKPLVQRDLGRLWDRRWHAAIFTNPTRYHLVVSTFSKASAGWPTASGQASIDRLQGRWPNLRLVHLPVHASWLNQVEIYLSVLQRKVLTPTTSPTSPSSSADW